MNTVRLHIWQSACRGDSGIQKKGINRYKGRAKRGTNVLTYLTKYNKNGYHSEYVNERRGNPHILGQAATGPETSLYKDTA